MKIKLFKPALVILAIALLGIQACKKDQINITNQSSEPVSGFNSLKDWSKSMAPAIQKFTVNLTTGGTITGDKGYKFYFAPGSLTDNIGNPITGNVEVKLQEITSAAEMLATGARTEAEDGILASAGMFNLELSKSGQPVFVNQNKPIRAQVMANPNVVMDNVEVLRGVVQKDTIRDTSVRWRRDSSNFKSKMNWDSIRQVYDSMRKIFESRRCITFDLYFGRWCNLDRYYNNPTGEKVRIKADSTKNNLDTRVFMYLNQNNLKGFYELFKDPSDPEEFNSATYKLPIGWQITIIVVTRDNKKVVKYESRIITNTAGTIHKFSSLKAISDADLEAFFKTL